MIPIEYASIGRHRSEFRGQISALQRQRLALLKALEATGAHMSAWERRELTLLERLQGTDSGPELSADELLELAQLMNDTTLPQLGHRSMTHTMTPRQRQLATLENRWPKPRLSGRQAVLELYRQRGN